MRRGISSGLLLLGASVLTACGPDWQPSWNMSSTPVVTSDSLTVQRVTGNDPEIQVLRNENAEDLRLNAGLLTSSRPTSPEAAMTSVPEYRPVARPDVDAHTGPREPTSPPREPPPPLRAGSSTPPPVASVPPRAVVPVRPAAPPVLPREEGRVEGRVVQVPGQPAGAVTGGTGRVQSFSQPGNPAGGVAIQDGGQTTIIQPGGRVVTVPSTR